MAVFFSKIMKTMVAAVEQAVNRFNAQIDSFEVENEATLNTTTFQIWKAGFWKTYTVFVVHIFWEICKKVLSSKLIRRRFFATRIIAHTQASGFDVNKLIRCDGDDKNDGNEVVTTWNRHTYDCFDGMTDPDTTFERPVNHYETSTQFRWWMEQAKRAQALGTPSSHCELGSVGLTSCPRISNASMASLWTLNLILSTVQLDLAAIQGEMTVNCNASSWPPIRTETGCGHRSLHLAGAPVGNQNTVIHNSSRVGSLVDMVKGDQANVHLGDPEAVAFTVARKSNSSPALPDSAEGFQPARKPKGSGVSRNGSGLGRAAATAITMTVLSIAANTARNSAGDEESRGEDPPGFEGDDEHGGHQNEEHVGRLEENGADTGGSGNDQGVNSSPMGYSFLDCVTALVILACVIVALTCAVYAIAQFFI